MNAALLVCEVRIIRKSANRMMKQQKFPSGEQFTKGFGLSQITERILSSDTLNNISIGDGKGKIYIKLLQNRETSFNNVNYEYDAKILCRAQQNVAVPVCV